jgi:hypothetical protein
MRDVKDELPSPVPGLCWDFSSSRVMMSASFSGASRRQETTGLEKSMGAVGEWG